MNPPVIYYFFLAMREEIERHKWIESEKAGHDIGLELARLDWILKHRAGWKRNFLQAIYSSSFNKNS